jgi:hypothetical protein
LAAVTELLDSLAAYATVEQRVVAITGLVPALRGDVRGADFATLRTALERLLDSEIPLPLPLSL